MRLVFLVPIDEEKEREKDRKHPQAYKPKVEEFLKYFYESVDDISHRNLKSIHTRDVSTCLMKVVDSNHVNHYYSLKSFFDFTYSKDYTSDVMKNIRIPKTEVKNKEYLNLEEINKIKLFCNDKNQKIEDRLLIGFNLYTGLSRKFLKELEFGYFQPSGDNRYYLQFNNFKTVTICSHLSELFNEYKETYKVLKGKNKIFNYDGNYLSTKTKDITVKIISRKITPTIYSNTFIKEMLRITKNDVLMVSELLMESPHTISQHLEEIDEEEIKYERYLESLEMLYEKK
ncbi:hypothetical protein [Lysinibacillus xylanilyticus]|uniref:Site-specific integrase n=1 Tax=Lysinibacillus xylanilyticus TaxID=582475 RepID=A0ABT4EYQ3_9BACI|nr:hypothetical protein [Lysinibacillus xylanilyticus]MCY9549349.1 hypothetical protein [Lysinibacillus xylanilyticus]